MEGTILPSGKMIKKLVLFRVIKRGSIPD